jgi:hypothetical protein
MECFVEQACGYLDLVRGKAHFRDSVFLELHRGEIELSVT